MDKSNLLTLVIVALVVFIIGGALGIAFQAQKAGGGAVVKTLSSKVIPSIIAYGTVTKIDGKKLTLTYASDTITVSVIDSAQVYSFTQSATASAPVQAKANFSDIKVGKNVNVSLKMLPTGELQGTTVIILPETAATVK